MQVRGIKFVVMIAMVAVIAYGCSGSSSYSPAAANVSGVVAKGYVEGATVFADKNGNFVRDAGEVAGQSDAFGRYTFKIPDLETYGKFRIVSIGGTMLNSNGFPVPAPPMLAPMPEGFANNFTVNVTLASTLVALVPGLEAKIEAQTGTAFDSDIADVGGTDPQLLALSLALSTVLDMLSRTSIIDLSDPSAVFEVLKLIATEMNRDAISLSDPDDIALACETGVGLALQFSTSGKIDPDGLFPDDGKVSTAIGVAVKRVVNSIPPDTDLVKESDYLAEKERAVMADQANLWEDASVNVSVQEIILKNGIDDPHPVSLQTANNTQPPESLELDLAKAKDVDIIEFFALTRNDLGVDMFFPNASLFLQIVDESSERKISIRINNVDVTVTSTGGLDLALEDTKVEMEVDGFRSTGEKADTIVFQNLTQGQDIVTQVGEIIRINLDTLNAKLVAAGSPDNLTNIGRRGNFVISVEADHAPMTAVSGTVLVQ